MRKENSFKCDVRLCASSYPDFRRICVFIQKIHTHTLLSFFVLTNDYIMFTEQYYHRWERLMNSIFLDNENKCRSTYNILMVRFFKELKLQMEITYEPEINPFFILFANTFSTFYLRKKKKEHQTIDQIINSMETPCFLTFKTNSLLLCVTY